MRALRGIKLKTEELGTGRETSPGKEGSRKDLLSLVVRVKTYWPSAGSCPEGDKVKSTTRGGSWGTPKLLDLRSSQGKGYSLHTPVS